MSTVDTILASASGVVGEIKDLVSKRHGEGLRPDPGFASLVRGVIFEGPTNHDDAHGFSFEQSIEFGTCLVERLARYFVPLRTVAE